jgi:hypothetical protein
MTDTDEQKRRGRPRRIPQDMRSAVEYVAGAGTRTERGLQNTYYSMFCMDLLEGTDDDAQRYIMNTSFADIQRGAGRISGRGLMVEIGRWFVAAGEAEADSAIVDAVNMRKRGMSSSGVARAIRARRIGQEEENQFILLRGITKTIEEYRKRFPKTSSETILGVLDFVRAVEVQND